MDRAVATESETAEPPLFRPRFPWLTGDLQTLRNMIVRPRFDFADAPGRPVEFAMDDGTGDRLLAILHEPRGGKRPLALLVHGLTGDSDSFYMQSAARTLLDAGFPVLRLNLRGAGLSAGLCREQYHAGRSADLAAVIGKLATPLTESGIVAIGFSLGGNTLLKLLGETGSASPIRAAAAVSPPVDLAGAARCIQRRRNALYQRYLLARMKAEARRSRGGLAPSIRAAAARAPDIVTFDDTVVAPRYGFASAADYYSRCSAAAFAASIRVPTLVVHARDDPWIPADPLEAPVWQENAALHLALAEQGGHVGFHGAGARQPWHDALILRFMLNSIVK